MWSMFRFNNKDTRMRPSSGVFIVNFKHCWHLVLVFFYCWLWTSKCRLGKLLLTCHAAQVWSFQSIVLQSNFSSKCKNNLPLHWISLNIYNLMKISKLPLRFKSIFTLFELTRKVDLKLTAQPGNLFLNSTISYKRIKHAKYVCTKSTWRHEHAILQTHKFLRRYLARVAKSC